MVGGAAEKAQPAGVKIEVAPAGVLALEQVLDRLLELESAALQKTDADPRAGKRARDADAGGARADDAEVAFDRGAVLEFARVTKSHKNRSPARSGAGPSGRNLRISPISAIRNLL
jgi:hypothetical protein